MSAPARASTTRRTLRWLGVALLGLPIALGPLATAAFLDAHNTADTVRIRSIPAILEVSSARAALVAADRAAIDSFHTGEVQLAGPGEQYRNQIAIASQSLAQVAEDNVAGEAGSQILRLVEGLLVAYTGSIEQAAAQFRQAGGTVLGTADLWYASRLLHAPSSGILAQLDALREAQRKALELQLASGPISTVAVVSWVVLVLVLLALLGVTQVFLKRRFRRTLNPALFAALLCLLVLAAVACLTFVSQNRLDNATTALDQVVAEWQEQDLAAQSIGQRSLADLVARQCRPQAGECGSTVARYVSGLPPASELADDSDNRGLTERTRKVNAEVAAAGEHAGLWLLIPLAASVVMVLVVFGLYPRIDEYRYRTR